MLIVSAQDQSIPVFRNNNYGTVDIVKKRLILMRRSLSRGAVLMAYALWCQPILAFDIVDIVLGGYLSRGGMFRSYTKVIVTVVLSSWIFTFCITLTFSIVTTNMFFLSTSADSWSWTFRIITRNRQTDWDGKFCHNCRE